MLSTLAFFCEIDENAKCTLDLESRFARLPAREPWVGADPQ